MWQTDSEAQQIFAKQQLWSFVSLIKETFLSSNIETLYLYLCLKHQFWKKISSVENCGSQKAGNHFESIALSVCCFDQQFVFK